MQNWWEASDESHVKELAETGWAATPSAVMLKVVMIGSYIGLALGSASGYAVVRPPDLAAALYHSVTVFSVLRVTVFSIPDPVFTQLHWKHHMEALALDSVPETAYFVCCWLLYALVYMYIRTSEEGTAALLPRAAVVNRERSDRTTLLRAAWKRRVWLTVAVTALGSCVFGLALGYGLNLVLGVADYLSSRIAESVYRGVMGLVCAAAFGLLGLANRRHTCTALAYGLLPLVKALYASCDFMIGTNGEQKKLGDDAVRVITSIYYFATELIPLSIVVLVLTRRAVRARSLLRKGGAAMLEASANVQRQIVEPESP